MTDIFTDGEAAPTPQPAVAQPAAFEVPEDLKEFIGEGKKYATVEAALKSIPHAQRHIETLLTEAAELKTKAERGLAVDDVRAAVEDLLRDKSDKTKPVDEATLVSLVDNRLAAQRAAEAERKNVETFKGELGKVYGDKAKDQFDKVASENGFTPAELSDLVKKSPAAALKLFDLKPSGQRHIQSDFNSEALRPPNPNLPEKKSVMSGSSHKDLMSQWTRAKLLVDQENQGV